MDKSKEQLKQISEQLLAIASVDSDFEHKQALWKAERAADEAKRELLKAREQLDEERKESHRLRNECEYWRKAVHYEQSMKRPRKQVRHLPTFSMVHRSKLKVKQWTNRERVFLKHWREENKNQAGINGGRGVLELILSNDSNFTAANISQRDATVAATVIQWLGTNCGFAFLHEVNREIEQMNKREALAV